ncbi:MAG: YigZ family protein [bacterium]|nr:YigZ family protein [bacterium]
MYVIDKNVSNEIIIKNSRFITFLFKVETKNEIEDKLESIKKNHPKATHYCYAYITNKFKKSSDDGEPGGTAGIPILNVLEKEKLTNILAIVVRYFGGIKLGAGGLVRAYSKSITEALSKTNYISLVNGYLIELTFDYKNQKNIDYILKDSIIKEQNFKEKIFYKVLIKKELLESLSPYNPNIINESLIEKYD